MLWSLALSCDQRGYESSRWMLDMGLFAEEDLGIESELYRGVKLVGRSGGYSAIVKQYYNYLHHFSNPELRWINHGHAWLEIQQERCEQDFIISICMK